MIHHPPSASGGITLKPHSGPGGSSASQGSWRTNCTGSQLTEASMLKPMISKAKKPKMSDATPSLPK